MGTPSNNFKLAIDQNIVDYYYSLIPKYFVALRPGHAAHITVVREYEVLTEKIVNSLLMFVGQKFQFTFGPNLIYQINHHFIIECNSKDLENLRMSVGLPKHRTPFNSFHFTVGYINDK